MLLEIQHKSQENTCNRASFLINFIKALLKKQSYEKGDSDRGVLCEFCEFSKTTFFREHLCTTASAKPITHFVNLRYL